MNNPLDGLNVLKEWKPGDTRELNEAVLKKARIEGLFDSYRQIYELDRKQWKVQDQVSRASGETVYTLVCIGG